MQYQGKIKTDIGLEMIFMCNNDPGMCDEWDSENLGNKVIIISGENLEILQPLDKTLSLREAEYGIKIVEVVSDDYDSARESWSGNKREV